MKINKSEQFNFYALKLCGILILIFIFQYLIGNFTDYFILKNNSWEQPWRFITAFFLHGGIAHLLYNLIALALFGSILERLTNGKIFIIIYFLSGIGANIISAYFYPSSLGASGAIFGIIGALIIVKPLQVVWAFSLPMPIFLAGIIWGLGDILGAYGFFTGNPINNTGNIAHLSGMFIGFIIGILLRTSKSKRKNEKVINESEIRQLERNYLES